MLSSSTTNSRIKDAGFQNHLVAIVVPLSYRNFFTEDEKISLLHLNHYLKGYDKYFVAPENNGIKKKGFKIKRFDSSFFGSVNAHRRLLFSKSFYEEFSNYKFILIYHLDALVFSDQLTSWCDIGFDYVGPPWIKHRDAPYFGNPEYEGKVGNGGFSLRKVESFISVINSTKLWKNPLRRFIREFGRNKTTHGYPEMINMIRYWSSKYNGIKNEMAHYNHNEDHFWANRAAHYYPLFKVPSVDVALKFAFECVPKFCYDLNNRKLPFGCHAWSRYDREFWTPFLLKTNG